MASSRAFRSGDNEDSIGFGDTGDALIVHFAREDWDMPYQSATLAQSLPAQLEITVRGGLDPAESYSVVLGLRPKGCYSPGTG